MLVQHITCWGSCSTICTVACCISHTDATMPPCTIRVAAAVWSWQAPHAGLDLVMLGGMWWAPHAAQHHQVKALLATAACLLMQPVIPHACMQGSTTPDATILQLQGQRRTSPASAQPPRQAAPRQPTASCVRSAASKLCRGAPGFCAASAGCVTSCGRPLTT